MREVIDTALEPSRWNVVFHRKAENWFFAAIAFGRFKHVSAFAWVPELSIWLFYDVGFRRTRLFAVPDGATAQGMVGALARGNCIVTVDVREDALPWMRGGLFCTTAIKHLIGSGSGALRPDRLYRHLVASGGTVRDDESRSAKDRDRSESCE